MTKKLFIKTYGCQMNVYDSARMADVLTPLGYVAVAEPGEADLIVLNTCHIREKAAEKVYSEIGRLRPLKRGAAPPLIAVAGCVAQAEGEEMTRRAPEVDIVVGPQSYHRLPRLIADALARRSGSEAPGGKVPGLVETEFPAESKFDFLPEDSGASGVSAFLTVQEGCDKFCTFCVVPYTRGAEYSRPVADILAEARRLVARGAREITLLGQNVNAYHGADIGGASAGLGRLVRRLAEIEGLARLRYTTSHPRDMDDELIAAHGELPQLMPFLHLPVQSGSDAILKAMNRRHRAADYRALVARLRDARPDLALSSDFIVGFPGESDADFAATLALVREIGFAQAYSFKYSPRPGTPAAELAGQVPEDVKSARLTELQTTIAAQQSAFNAACVGRSLPVLFEAPGRHPGQWVGRSPYLQAVHVESAEPLAGRLADVTVLRTARNSLAGRLAAAARSPHAA